MTEISEHRPPLQSNEPLHGERGFGLFPLLEQFFSSNRIPIVFLFSVACLLYGYEIFNFNFSIDEETAGIARDPVYWLKTGRWVTYLLNRYLFHHTSIPVVPLAFSLFLCAVSVIAIFRLFDRANDYAVYLFPLLILTYPSLPFILAFSLNAPGIGIGMLCVAIGLHIILNNKGARRLVAVMFFVAALGIYQSFLFLIAAMLLAVHLTAWIKNWTCEDCDTQLTFRNSLRELFSFFLYVILSVSLYFLINQLVLYFLGLQMAYITEFVQPAALVTKTQSVIMSLVREFTSAYAGLKGMYIDNTLLVPVLLFVAMVAPLTRMLLATKKVRPVLWAAALFIILMLVPFAHHFLSGGEMPIRTLLALPFVIVAIWWLGYRFSPQPLQRAFIICGAILVIQFSIINNRHFHSIGIALEHDKGIASGIIEEIEKVIAADGEPLCIEFVGSRGYPANEFVAKTNIFGASFFEWEGGNPTRMGNFLRLMGLNIKINLCSVKKRQELMHQVAQLPAWPREGAVSIVDGALVVKLTDYSKAQMKALCGAGGLTKCQ